MQRVLLINQGHTPNLGDIAIAKVMENFFSQQGYITETMPYDEQVEQVFSLPLDRNDLLPKSMLRLSPVMDALNHRRIRRLLNDKHFDFAVIGGGELLGRHFGFNSSFVSWCSELSSRKIPIYVTGVSGDLHMQDYYLNRYRKALRKCVYVSARDHSTERILHERYGIEAHYSPDVVFAYNHLFKSQHDTDKKDIVCVPVPCKKEQLQALRLQSENDYFRYLANLISQHNEEATKKVIITSTVQTDEAIVHRFAQYCSAHTSYDIAVRPYPALDEFMHLIDQANYTISGRMHACILGLISGSRIIPIPFKEKLAVFAQEYSSADNIEKVSEEAYQGLIHITRQQS